mgnify:CR=1 FL=1
MTVALLSVELYLPMSQSLKDKRMVLRRLKDRLGALNVAVAEVAHQDVWQRAGLGIVAMPHIAVGSSGCSGIFGDDSLRPVAVSSTRSVCATTDDAIHPAAHAAALARLIPQARLVELPPKGRDKPAHLAALAAALRQFLKEF